MCHAPDLEIRDTVSIIDIDVDVDVDVEYRYDLDLDLDIEYRHRISTSILIPLVYPFNYPLKLQPLSIVTRQQNQNITSNNRQ